MAQAPPPPAPPPAPKEVTEKPVYVRVTLKASTKTPNDELGQVANSKTQIYRVVMIASCYREAIVSQRGKVPSKCFKDSQINIFTDKKEVVATTTTQPTKATLVAATNLAGCLETPERYPR